MPTLKPTFSFSGMEFTSQVRMFRTVSTAKMAPEMKMAPRACCHENPMTFTTVKAMNAFSPMYGAMAKGRFAYRPMSSVPRKAVRMVATMEAPKGIPAASSTLGFTMMM